MVMGGIALFGKLGVEVLAVEAGNVAQGDVLGTFGGAGTGVGAVAEAQLVHLGHHGAGATLALNLALGQQSELADLGRDKEHCRAVFAGCYAGAATDAGGAVHGLVGDSLGDGYCVGIGGAAAVHRHVAAGLLNLVKGVAVDHEVAHDGEGCRAPGLDGDGVAVVEFAHVQLAGGDALHEAVGVSVDVERAHAADALAAVRVEHYGFLALFDELTVCVHPTRGVYSNEAVWFFFFISSCPLYCP